MRFAITYDRPFGVPYLGFEREDGTKRHDYCDLRLNPETIYDLPEVAEFPELAEFLQSVNAPTSSFRTLGCEKSFSDFGHEHFQVKLVSYVDVAFADWASNTRVENFYVLIGSFSRFAWDRGFKNSGEEDSKPVVVDFEMRPTLYHEQSMTGWSMALWIGAFGTSKADARDVWAEALKLFQDFFQQASGGLYLSGSRP